MSNVAKWQQPYCPRVKFSWKRYAIDSISPLIVYYVVSDKSLLKLIARSRPRKIWQVYLPIIYNFGFSDYFSVYINSTRNCDNEPKIKLVLLVTFNGKKISYFIWNCEVRYHAGEIQLSLIRRFDSKIKKIDYFGR